MEDCRNELEIQFLGLQRSGNHAVLSWLFKQFDEPVYFFNNAKHFGNPLQEFQPLDLPNTISIRRGSSPGRKRQLEEIGQKRKKVLVYSYENLPLRGLRNGELVPNKTEIVGISSSLRRVLIIRDFGNWLASRIRYHETVRGDFPSIQQVYRFVDIWTTYAREFLGETRYTRDVDPVLICFNRWVCEENYRRNLLGSLGVEARDNAISYVPAAGGGSSFDATTFSGRAEQMEVFERWHYLKERKMVEAVLALRKRHPDLEALNDKIFGSKFSFDRIRTE